jgi:hypothetical protein
MERSERNPILGRLECLIGEWELRAVMGGSEISGGRTSFEWLEDDFVIQRATAELPPDTPPEWVRAGSTTST